MFEHHAVALFDEVFALLNAVGTYRRAEQIDSRVLFGKCGLIINVGVVFFLLRHKFVNSFDPRVVVVEGRLFALFDRLNLALFNVINAGLLRLD
ncbi:hypothetical protein D1872_269910 [compost metagenome]